MSNTLKGAEIYTHTHTHTHTHGCLCKLIFSIIAIAIISPSYSDPSPSYDINAGANSADCVSDTLHATSGNVNLNANWSANTVNITYYSDNSEFTTGSCTYDQSLLIPQTEPTKTGYTFGGWKVRTAVTPSQPQQTLDCSIYNPAERNNPTWAATNEYIAECESHSGCVWNENRRNYYEGECVNIIPVESTSYTTCAEITDKDTCLGLYVDNGYSGHDGYKSLCAFKNNECEPLWEWGMGSGYITMPESFCEELGVYYGVYYEDGNCYVDD